MPKSPPVTTLRVMGRLSVAFILELVKVGRQGRDFIDSLLLLAIIQANLAPLVRDPQLQLTYGSYDSPPPDSLRRPVSVHAIAQSLDMPYETVRRHVAQQVALGICEMTGEGVFVSQAVLHSPQHRAVIEATCDAIHRFYLRLRSLGALGDIGAAAPPCDPAAPPVRAMVRVSSDYLLRIVEALTQHIGDLPRGIVWFGILTANTEHLPDREAGDGGASPLDFVADHLRRPTRVASLAERLDIPEETVRRQTVRLVQDGFAARTREGLIVPAEVLARANTLRLMAENHGHLRRMFAALAQLGVVAAWEREILPAAAG